VKPWGVKDLIRKIVLTRAFRQSSAPRDDGLQADAGASLLWRFPPRRVEAEVIRDSILQASGKLDRQIGGRSYRIHNVKKTYAQWEVVSNYSKPTWRRMIYQERMRPVSTTPLQALNLMNSPYVVSQAQLIAERAVADGGGDASKTTSRIFELLPGRLPSENEAAACQDIEPTLIARSLINSNEFAFLP